MSDEPTYLFIRVPKCASTALREALLTAYPTHKNLKFRSPVRYSWSQGLYGNARLFKKEKRMLWNNFSVFSYSAMWQKLPTVTQGGAILSGHIKYAELKLDMNKVRLVTLLRHPVDRLISEYNYSRASFHNKRLSSKLLYTNERSHAGEGSLSDYVAYLEANTQSKNSFQLDYLVDPTWRGDPVDFLDKHYFCYGVVEDLNGFRRDFEGKAGTTLDLKSLNRSSGENRESISTSLRNRIERLCAKDMVFYQCVVARLAERRLEQ